MKKEFIIEGTSCESCEKAVVGQAMKVKGVKSASFDLKTEKGTVEFDENITDIDEILSKIEEKGYEGYLAKKDNKGWIFAIIGMLAAGYFAYSMFAGLDLSISENMSLGLLFLVGLLTGFHCIGMCGGFVLSYTASAANKGHAASHIKYGIGKTISYTVIGAAFGLLGSIIAFTPMMRGVAGILAGIFLVLFGIKMLNVFPALRAFQIRTPAFVHKMLGKQSSPLVIGLLNGLMIACGPLQALYVMAAGTGSMILGAQMLFVFGLGTLPVMLGFGYMTSVVSGKITRNILKASGVVVVLLGLIMVNRGLALTGTGLDVNTLAVRDVEQEIEMQEEFQVIRMDVTRAGWEPDQFVLQKDVPVRWIINGREITGCNNAINVPKLGLEFDIDQGEQVIEFTPTEEGVIPWSCWMGMIPGTFVVTDDANQPVEMPEVRTAGTCGGSCGGSCGGGCGCSA